MKSKLKHFIVFIFLFFISRNSNCQSINNKSNIDLTVADLYCSYKNSLLFTNTSTSSQNRRQLILVFYMSLDSTNLITIVARKPNNIRIRKLHPEKLSIGEIFNFKIVSVDYSRYSAIIK